MKPNVDLTMDSDFSGRGSRLETLHDLVAKLHGNFPWNLITRDYEIDSRKNELVVTGSKSDRESKRFSYNFASGEECDCCGALVNRVPWKIRTLCRRCDNGLEDSHNRKPWNNFWFEKLMKLELEQ